MAHRLINAAHKQGLYGEAARVALVVYAALEQYAALQGVPDTNVVSHIVERVLKDRQHELQIRRALRKPIAEVVWATWESRKR